MEFLLSVATSEATSHDQTSHGVFAGRDGAYFGKTTACDKPVYRDDFRLLNVVS